MDMDRCGSLGLNLLILVTAEIVSRLLGYLTVLLSCKVTLDEKEDLAA